MTTFFSWDITVGYLAAKQALIYLNEVVLCYFQYGGAILLPLTVQSTQSMVENV
jgi:hypothetical protein